MEVKGIIDIEVKNIHPHVDNPRKDLGDLTELVESIKKNGIMQNLTVIPDKDKPGEYITIIGHRRCEAARQAGITEVPCRIIEGMTEREQMSTMLEENMQRNDLTIWEQAQGFQMMLNLGETEETISEKTGFSKTTIKHRLNIAKLDSATLREKEKQEGYQLSLTDLYELEKIKDVKRRDEILKESTSSSDLVRRALYVQDEEKRQENLELYLEILKKIKVTKAPKEAEQGLYSNKWDILKTYRLEDKPNEKFESELRNNKKELFFVVSYRTLYIVSRKKKKEKKLTPEEEQRNQRVKNKKQILKILKEATNTRRIFIEGIIAGKLPKIKNIKHIEEGLFEQMLSWNSFIGENKLVEFFLGPKIYEATQEEIDETKKKIRGLSVEHKLLCLVSTMVGEACLVDWNNTYNEVDGTKVKKFYQVLEEYGFAFLNDEEQKAIDGSSELYEKKGE